MELRFDTRFFAVELRPDSIAALTRKPVPYETLEEVAQGYDDLTSVVKRNRAIWRVRCVAAGHSPDTFGWLYDVRTAPPARNDPEFEAVHAAGRPKLFALSPHLCVLCNTAAGVMQMTRMARGDSQPWFASNELGDAVQKLQQAMRD